MVSIWRWISDLRGGSDVPNPGLFDDINQDAIAILHPTPVEGLSFNFNAPLSEVFSLGSSVELGAKEGPGQFAFNANYFSNNIAMISRSNASNGRIFARVIMNHTPTLSSKIMADVGHEPDSSRFSGDLDYRGLQSSSQAKLTSGRIVSFTHLHALSKAFSVGGEAMIQTRSGFAAFTVATKYNVPGESASLSIASFGPLIANYVREVSPKVSFATELFLDTRTRDSQVTLGYKFNLSRASVIGNVDSTGKVVAILEERINPAFTLSLCGELNHVNNTQSFGIGVNIGGG